MSDELILDAEMEKQLPAEAVSLIKSEAYHLTKEIKELTVVNREQYEQAAEKGIANANILKKLEALREALLMEPNLEITRMKKQIAEFNKSFDKAVKIFEGNDEKVREAMKRYASKVDVTNIKTIHTDLGMATMQERADFEVIGEVPIEYCKPDETKIRRAVVAGILKESDWLKLKTQLVPTFKAA